MNRTIRPAILGAAALTALAALGATPAFADSTPAPAPSSATVHSKTPRTLTSVQASAAAATGKRIASLNAAIAKVTANTSLVSSDKAALLGNLTSDLGGMNTLASKIAADSDLAQAKIDYADIFTTYRVSSVALPQSVFVTFADTVTSKTTANLAAEQTRLSGLLSGKDASKSTEALQADLTDMAAQIGKATGAVSGLAAGSLAVTPEQYAANHDVMKAFKASATTARAALKQAQTDAKTIRAALK
ncbi:hypothetical protein QN345_02975 [Cryobacterium sp. 10I1]|uniref:hypothetical protein n=1 Tax=unclassified Cryobacterium TaxID=2649013 RepID=UPI002B237EAE|nr:MULTISPECIES: hypothetical protein [unclassified Cryobacterium]MEB0002442.1 hypothetical protein [Cryobacterium sp. RTC2.1]MEB0304297.1 hypothetical protein [Cryobacterium sp. 10I1]